MLTTRLPSGKLDDMPRSQPAATGPSQPSRLTVDVLAALAADDRLSDSSRLVYIALLALADSLGRETIRYPGTVPIHRVTGLHRTTVTRAVRQLVDASLVTLGKARLGPQVAVTLAIPKITGGQKSQTQQLLSLATGKTESESDFEYTPWFDDEHDTEPAATTAAADASQEPEPEPVPEPESITSPEVATEPAAKPGPKSKRTRKPKVVATTEQQERTRKLEGLVEYMRWGWPGVGATDEVKSTLKSSNTDWTKVAEGEDRNVQLWNAPMFAGWWVVLISWVRTQYYQESELERPSSTELSRLCGFFKHKLDKGCTPVRIFTLMEVLAENWPLLMEETRNLSLGPSFEIICHKVVWAQLETMRTMSDKERELRLAELVERRERHG